MFGEVGFQAFCQFAAGQQDSPAAAPALQTDIRTQAHNGPFIRTAWVRFAQAQVIVEAQIGKHMQS
jgi:hypothetical protein